MKPPQQLYKGTSPCGRPRCKSCMHIRTGNAFESATMEEKFEAHVTTNCKSKNIVYLTECRKCKKQYIGETENLLHLWMNGHRSDYYQKLPSKPVTEHFNTTGHFFEDLTVIIIKQIVAGSTRRKQQESLWTYTLQTLAPDNRNLDP